ncbi:3-oxoacyl-[acyl-carrier protein] reductase [Halorubrum vacuolatum]|uniref:3-oxoacyl-[acyl-carrier protein] reductase n=2 Tax=Halorubrum vacuolatum TaxID=63740 RepID=A0A238YCJ8_HALVU|nr:3-oxoacyl-[acyl-carrier protein] reductase [Halorubrum vacuolatum]
MGLKNNVAIVTGGASGIGRGIASVLSEKGARVVVADIDEETATKTATELPGEAMAVGVDVTDPAETEALAETVIEEYGQIDVLCANAGIYPSKSLEEMTVEDWDGVFDINAKGVMLSVAACLPHMKNKDYGRIVITSSITGPMVGYPGWAHYGATKGAVNGFLRTAAIEVANWDITVNAVMPGNIETGGLDDLGEEYLAKMRSSIPKGELGTPEDIGHAAAFFASEEAGYVTGTTLVVDGGQTLPESQLALEAIEE